MYIFFVYVLLENVHLWCACNFNSYRGVIPIYFYFLLLSTSYFSLCLLKTVFNIQPWCFEYNKSIASNHCMRFLSVHPSHLAYLAMLPTGDSKVDLKFYHCSEPHSTSSMDQCENIFEPHTNQQMCGGMQDITFLFCTSMEG